MINNPFSLAFGKEPKTIISNSNVFDKIKDVFLMDYPTFTTNLITGVRGSGKTVLLTRLMNSFDSLDDWIVVELNPETDMLEYLASSIYEKGKFKFKFLKKAFNFSFHGLSVSLSGDNPVSSVITLLEKMFEILIKQNKKVLICVDDVSSNQNVRVFVQQYQIFLRRNYPVFLLMTGLFENVRTLQNEKSLTFLYRSPRTDIGPLSLINIAESFEKILNVSSEEAIKLSKITNGYAFAYQVLGYVMYEQNKKEIDKEVLKDFDKYLREYVYEKIYTDLPENEKRVVNATAKTSQGGISEIMKITEISKESLSQYRDKLLKKGVLVKNGWGKLEFALPRFKEYVLLQQKFN